MATTHPAAEYVQLRVELEEIQPPIWRRLRVSGGASFWDLHVAIQDAMGWLDCHLHEFTMEEEGGKLVRIGSAFEDADCLPGWETPIRGYLKPGTELIYEYDFGDGWRHHVLVEESDLRTDGEELPVCMAGARACPPEDCGGAWGYAELIEAYDDPSHERHGEIRELYAGEYDPEAFEPGEVRFDDPSERLKVARAGM